MRENPIAEKTLLEMIEDLYDQFENGTIPNIRISTRTKKNIEYNEDSEVWV
nr:type 2 DNA topoisomerase 6 subunit A [Methanosarcinales archaeon ANME-2c ERB4]